MWRALAAAAPTAADVRNSRRDRRASTVELRSAEDGVGLRRRTEAVNLLPSHACPTIPTVSVLEDPPTPRAVVRGILGLAAVVAAVALVVVSLAVGHIEWRLAALALTLWSAYGFRSEERRVGKECRSRWS